MGGSIGVGGGGYLNNSVAALQAEQLKLKHETEKMKMKYEAQMQKQRLEWKFEKQQQELRQKAIEIQRENQRLISIFRSPGFSLVWRTI